MYLHLTAAAILTSQAHTPCTTFVRRWSKYRPRTLFCSSKTWRDRHSQPGTEYSRCFLSTQKTGASLARTQQFDIHLQSFSYHDTLTDTETLYNVIWRTCYRIVSWLTVLYTTTVDVGTFLARRTRGTGRIGTNRECAIGTTQHRVRPTKQKHKSGIGYAKKIC